MALEVFGEGEALWARVVKSLYGELVWGKRGNVRWREEVGRKGGGRKLWIGEEGGAIKRLVGESGFWEGELWVWAVEWMRELREREKGQVEELLLVVSDFAPCTGLTEGWRWKATPDGFFTTKSAYDLLAATREEQQVQPLEMAKVWKAPTPHKAKVTAWRCLRNRLATCDNLRRINIQIGVEERWCNACVSSEETTEHLFLHCPKAAAVWDQIYQWLDIKTANPRSILQHFISFIAAGKRKKDRRLLKALWMGTVWLFWES
ncbi:uncharacterized protein LOC131021118 [Salvia miltiorrhiza]|uniref:uncharacterized protein LOC131021118 n=1 Tax=Salvia miltiorrhiza TaxID=226208 RepID=UPI0025ABE445|nr:uncharacterized protein LOC131021118 [Salvia miltiorrhiza]